MTVQQRARQSAGSKGSQMRWDFVRTSADIVKDLLGPGPLAGGRRAEAGLQGHQASQMR